MNNLINMSTTNTNEISNVGLTPIVAPSINDVNYASKLDNVFTNINNNFGTLANHEFIKGDAGKSVELKKISFFNEDGSLTYYGNKLKECILSLSSNQGEYADVEINGNTYNIWDNFTPDKASKLWMIYNTDSDINSTPVATTSLYYVFLDGRYANKEIGFADTDKYINLKDFSCILVYDTNPGDEFIGEETGKFTALTNAFPTIYYETGVGLCWKINGTGSGIPVQGVPGKDGSNANIQIVKVENLVESNTPGVPTYAEVTGIYEAFYGYRTLEDWKSTNNIESLNNQSALILVSVDGENKFYFGKLKIDDEILNAYCDPSTSINSAIKVEEIINAMKQINLLNNGIDASSGLKGLFIPLENEKNGKQGVHLISAASTSNIEGISEIKGDVLFTPVKDINNLKVEQPQELKVEKHLYLRLNKDHAIFAANSGAFGTDGYLKFKLEKIIYTIDSPNFNNYNNGIGSRRYGTVIVDYDDAGDPIFDDTTENNSVCVGSDGNISSNHLDSMPESFKSRLSEDGKNVPGIYMWKLDNSVAVYDPDEIRGDKTVDQSYAFSTQFTEIFTTTLTPSTNSDFMWWDALELHEDYKNYHKEPGNNTYVIPGWVIGEDDYKVFKFVKFVPTYLNSFALDSDTALNLNYNVNITGDENNPNKSLSVHGAVNCDELSVYKLTATGEIKNVYTKDIIVGERGINLANINDEYKFTVSSSGNVESQNLNVIENINSDSITTNNITAADVDAESLDVQVLDSGNIQASSHIGVSGVCNKAIGVNINNVHEIDIVACEHDASYLDSIEKVPLITSNVPAHMNGNSNIVISNQSNDSQNIYFKNTLRDNENNSGVGVSDNKNIDTTSFESAKNFNMHRLSMDAKSSSSTTTSSSTESKTIVNSDVSSTGVNSVYNPVWTIMKTQSMSRECSQETPVSEAKTKAYIEKNHLQKVSINGSTGTLLSSKNNIIINMNNYFWTLVGLYTGASYGKWGQLHSDSFLELEVYCITSDNNIYSTGVKKKYNFNHTTKSTANDNGYEWKGVKIDGTGFSSDDYDDKWRYRSYIFKPSSFTITPSSSNFSEITKAFNSGKTLTFYVVPRFKLKGFSQGDSRKLAGGVCATCPKPISPTKTSTIMTSKLDSGDQDILGKYVYSIAKTPTSCSGNLTYTVSTTNTSSNTTYDVESNVKATTLCNDGVVMRAGGYVFGLGYADTVYNHSKYDYNPKNDSDPHWNVINDSDHYLHNIPVLFYHKYNPNYYNSNYTPKNNSTTKEGYAQRTNAIPLEDLFDLIRYARSSENWKFGL